MSNQNRSPFDLMRDHFQKGVISGVQSFTDLLDGNRNVETDECSIGGNLEGFGVSDDELDGFILFADVDPSDAVAVIGRQHDWQEVLGAVE